MNRWHIACSGGRSYFIYAPDGVAALEKLPRWEHGNAIAVRPAGAWIDGRLYEAGEPVSRFREIAARIGDLPTTVLASAEPVRAKRMKRAEGLNGHGCGR